LKAKTVSAEIVREKSNLPSGTRRGEASLPDRVEPQCPYFGDAADALTSTSATNISLRSNERQVRDALQRIGKLKNVPMRPIIASPKQYGYRNRITVHAEEGVIGFYRAILISWST